MLRVLDTGHPFLYKHTRLVLSQVFPVPAPEVPRSYDAQFNCQRNTDAAVTDITCSSHRANGRVAGTDFMHGA